ncbi:MAG: Mut7-C RNAse domain-containing protein [Brevinematia bacterium]
MKFIADSMLGGLAKYLRMLGFDVLFFNKIEDKDIIRILETNNIILLTKDKKLKSENSKLSNKIFLIEAQNTIDQTIEVLKTFNLKDKVIPFSRCLICNTPLEKVNKKDYKNLIPKETYINFEEFYLCRRCNKVYWLSTHTDRMQILIERILKSI